MRVLVTVASGSATATLGRALAAHLGAELVDADDLYRLPTDPPFKAKRAVAEALRIFEPRGRVLDLACGT